MLAGYLHRSASDASSMADADVADTGVVIVIANADLDPDARIDVAITVADAFTGNGSPIGSTKSLCT